MKMRILCDLDGIVTDLLHKWLNAYNKDYPYFKQLTKYDVTEYIYNKISPIGRSMDHYIEQPGFFIDLPSLPGAISTLARLHKDGHEIYIVTSHSKYPGSAAEKIWWVNRNLPFIDSNHIVITKDKHVVRGDILIDDTPEKLLSYKKAWPDAYLITIEYPFNKEVENIVDLYAKDYTNTENAWRSIYSYITTV